ncbi:MAG: type II toxin-antitoxin system RelE/ParE family toxin [Candidatus Blackburnbacteria bacterium]|nr:type II toxin-antitoxin system RelE/ParE family toxin [Candidatus Blackburnbacteria bacterium]
MYKLFISTRVKRELKKISRSHKEAIVNALMELKDDPLVGKPLTRELTGKFSLRVGTYRVIYKINRQDKIIYILTAGHRSTVYN